MVENTITITGAREHNLKNISVTIPRGQLVIITGLSGSGKSSLAFDTIYAEGQRRYVESLSAYARQFLERMSKPDVDSITGLSPAISIEQKSTARNPRSTVATVTEIYDYLRLLYARVGVAYSPATGKPITAQTVSQMVDRLMAAGNGRRFYLMAPVVRGRKGEYRKDIENYRRRGFQRVRVDGTLYRIEDVPKLKRNIKHDIDIVVDRIQIRDDMEGRLADSFEIILELSDGLAHVVDADNGETMVFSSRFACPESGFTIDEIEPRLFSFNNPYGACPECDGLGQLRCFDAALVIGDATLSLQDGAITPWAKGRRRANDYYSAQVIDYACAVGVDTSVPWGALPQASRDMLMHGGAPDKKGRARAGDVEGGAASGSGAGGKKPGAFKGVLAMLTAQHKRADAWQREDLSRYMSRHPCPTCAGRRLKPQALAVKIDDKDISQVAHLTVAKSRDWACGLMAKMTPRQQEVARPILGEIGERLRFLNDVGLGYLTLARSAATLSGGEGQRIRLASQIGSKLTGVLYVLDEPSIGLHQRDNRRLLDTLLRLRDLGNTVIVVEHDEETIRAGDHLIDMGPRAGIHGGKVISQGTPDEVIASGKGLTSDYLSGRRKIPIPRRRSCAKVRHIAVIGAKAHNLENINVSFPVGRMTCVTGVSGSGKSTLVIDTLYRGLSRILHDSRQPVGACKKIQGVEAIDKVIDIDQSPIGRTPRSNPATYTGTFTPVREWFASLPESRARGYKSGRFSFNVKGGRCEACHGDGLVKIEMHFLPDVYVYCDECKGKRYNRETLEITYKKKSIAQVLDMTVREALDFFSAMPQISHRLQTLDAVGLGYIRLGQQATTLSGGEAQRVKLAKELSRKGQGRALYILDEPTTGLHSDDVRRLLEVIHRLVDQGNTVIIIEHNLDVIKTADWVIDLGPEGGDGGGRVIAAGTPETIAQQKSSYTAQFLAPLLSPSK